MDDDLEDQVIQNPESCGFHIDLAEKRRAYLNNAIFGYCQGRCCTRPSAGDGMPFRPGVKSDLFDDPSIDMQAMQAEIWRIQCYVIHTNRIEHQALILNLLGQDDTVVYCVKIHMTFPKKYSQLTISGTTYRPGNLVEDVHLAQPLTLNDIRDLCDQVSYEHAAENANYYFLTANCHVVVTRMLIALQLPLGLQLGSSRVVFSMILELAWKLIFIILAGLIFCGMIALFTLQARDSFDSLQPLSDLGDVVNCTVENDNFQNCQDGWGTCKIVCNQHRSAIEPPIAISGSCYGPELYGCSLVVSYTWNSSLFTNVLVDLKAHNIFDCSFALGDRRKATIQQCCGLRRVRYCVVDPSDPLSVLYISPKNVYRLQASRADFDHLFFILSMALIGSAVFIFFYTIFQSLPIVRYGIFCGWTRCKIGIGCRQFLITHRFCPCLTFKWVYSPITAFFLSWLILWWSSSAFFAALIAGISSTDNFAGLFLWLWFGFGMAPVLLIIFFCCCCTVCTVCSLCCSNQPQSYEEIK